MQSGAKVFTVVLNWNGSGDSIECVESLKKVTCPNHNILIVDNGSTDDSEGILRNRFPEITLIQTGRNLGYAGGNNAGIMEALKRGADYIILLNNDTVVDPGFAGELVTAAQADKRNGILCSKVYFYDRPDVIWYAGASFYTWLGWGRHRGFNQRDSGQFDTLEETNRPCGCSMMVARELCEKTGLLDDEYFCYSEDVDWGMRARKAGFRVMYVPASRVWHKVSQSTGGVSTAGYLYYSVRNNLRCLNINSPLPLVPRLFREAMVILTSLLSLFTMNIPKATGIKRIFMGVRDYHKGRFGKKVS